MDSLFCELERYIGQVVTIFTTSGGASGCGFTGVLISLDSETIRLLACMGEAPSCPIGSNCNGCNMSCSNENCNSGNPLGAVTIIPVCSVVAFTHNAI